RDMILEVSAHTRKVLAHRYSGVPQLRLVADAGVHQHLGGVDRSEGQHDLDLGTDDESGTAVRDLHTGGSVRIEDHASHQRVGEYREVGSVHLRIGVGPE